MAIKKRRDSQHNNLWQFAAKGYAGHIRRRGSKLKISTTKKKTHRKKKLRPMCRCDTVFGAQKQFVSLRILMKTRSAFV